LSVSGIGGGSNSSTLVSDGTRVVVERGGVVYPVTGKALRQMGDPTNADLVGLGALGVASWGVPPIKTTRANGAVRLTAAADPVAAINGIVALANEVSVTTSRLHTVSGDSASVLRKNLTSGSFSLRYGVSDHLLQFFWVELVFRPAALPVLRASLGPNAGTDVSMAVSVTQVNQPQHVTVPTVPT
ncbi:MAG TPA: hypothetical protein VE990_03165, partial [Acidimicrobiales bacterium]|nr:hypothetical protein [Acidimicrobiales bacterium]